MSGNLTKYQLLQHRHLSLLQALQDANIQAKCSPHGEWDVDYVGLQDQHGHPVRLERRDFTVEGICKTFGVPFFIQHNPADWLVDVRKLYGYIAPPLPADDAINAEYKKLSDAFQSGVKTIRSSEIPNILRARIDPMKFAALMEPVMPAGYEFTTRCKVYSLQEMLDIGWTIETMKANKIIVPKLRTIPTGWCCIITATDKGLVAAFGVNTKTVEMTPELVDLLRGVEAAIVAAPAKA